MPSGSSLQSPPAGPERPRLGLQHQQAARLLLFGSADLFGAFGTLGGMAAVLLIFTILISAFFDAMGTSVGLATEAGTIRMARSRTLTRSCSWTPSAP